MIEYSNEEDRIDNNDSLGLTAEELQICSYLQDNEKSRGDEFESPQHQNKLLLCRLEQSERTDELLHLEMNKLKDSCKVLEKKHANKEKEWIVER